MSVFEDLLKFAAIDRRSPDGEDLLSQIALIGASAVVFAVYLFVLNDLKWGVLFNDPASQFDLPTYAGLFTYASVMALVVATAVCLLRVGWGPR